MRRGQPLQTVSTMDEPLLVNDNPKQSWVSRNKWHILVRRQAADAHGIGAG